MGAVVYRQRQIARRFQLWRSEGLTADAQHDPTKAIDLLGKYLARYPDDVVALTCYAEDRLKVALPNDVQIPLAIQALRYAVHLDPTLRDQRRELIALYLQTGYWTEALDAAAAVLALDTPANAKTDREPIAARATALAKLRRIPEATIATDAWCSADPASVEARLLRLDLAHIAGQPAYEADTLVAKWSKSPALSKCAADLLRGHARVLDADPSAARAPLTAAAKDSPIDLNAAGPLTHDLDVVGLSDLALDVTRARFKANENNDSIRAELIRREWVARQFQAVLDLVTGVTNLTLLPTETLGLYAVAQFELHRLDPLAPVLSILTARSDATSRAWAALVGQLATNQFYPDRLRAACGPALQQGDGPILRYYVGQSYLTLGDRPRAAREWQRVVAADPTWPLPAVRLCQLLTEDARPKQALAAGFEAARRAPHDPEAITALARAWATAVDAGQDRDVDGCLQLIDQLIKQLPSEDRLPALQARVLARAGRSQAAADIIGTALASNRPLPEQVWFDFAAASTAGRLGLEQQCLDRNRSEHGTTPRSAYARAVVLHFSTEKQSAISSDPGLPAFDKDHAAALHSDSGDSANLTWQVARARYLDVTANPESAASWAALSDAQPKDPDIQRLVIASSAVQGNPQIMSNAVNRLKASVGETSVIYQLARARFDVLFGTTKQDADESRRLLDAVLQQSPESLDALMLSALANEKLGRPSGAIANLRTAASVDPESIPVRLALSQLLQSQGDFDGGLAQLDHIDLQLLTNDNQRQQAAALLVEHGEADRAIDLLNRTADSRSSATALMLARLYQRTGQPTRAISVLDQLLNAHPSATAVALKADLLASVGRVEEGRRSLDGLQQLPQGEISPATANVIRAEFALRHDGAAGAGQALSLLATASATDPNNPAIWRTRVAAEMSVDHVTDAIAVATQGSKILPDDQVLAFFKTNGADIEFASADHTTRPLLEAVIQDPEVIPAVTEAIQLVHSQATSERSVDWLSSRLADLAGRCKAFPQIALYRVAVYEKAGQLDEAVAVASQAGERFPDDGAVFRAVVDALTKASRWAEVISIADRWKRQVPTDALDADLAAAEALLKINRPADVPARLAKYVTDPTSPAYISALPVVARAKMAAELDDPISDMEPLLAQGPAGRAAWMTFAAQTMPPDQAADSIRRAVALMPTNDPAEHVKASEMWTKLGERTGDPAYIEMARKSLEPFLSQASSSFQVLLAAASWSEKSGNTAEAERLYRRCISLIPGDLWATNNLAMILARSDRAAEAALLMDKIMKAAREFPDLYDTRAFVLWKAGHLDSALSDIDIALRFAPRRASFRARRIQLLAALGRSRDAQLAIEQFDDDFPEKALVPADATKMVAEARQAAHDRVR